MSCDLELEKKTKDLPISAEVDRDPPAKNVECWAYSVDGLRLA